MRTLYRPKGETRSWRLEDTKTEKSRAPVPLVVPAVTALRRHHAKQAADRLVAGAGYAAHDFVFADEQGEPLRSDVVSKQWQRAIGGVNATRTGDAEAGGVKPTLLPIMRLYDARHTCATLLLEAGVPMRVVQEILRHSTMMLTANTYSHVRPVVTQQAMAQLEGFVSGTDESRTIRPRTGS
jgi:integrase